MSIDEYFFNMGSLENKGIKRHLSDDITAYIFPAEQSMASVVKIQPNARGKFIVILRSNGVF